VAALAGTHFSLELGAEVLELRTLEVQGALEELERVQVLRGAAFTHDLVFESVLAAIPKPVRTMLHGRLAAALETRRAPAAVVAQHWLAAGAGERAVPALEAAARAAEDTLRLTEAAALRAHAEALRAPPAAGGLASGA
jgi:predicted ATPase